MGVLIMNIVQHVKGTLLLLRCYRREAIYCLWDTNFGVYGIIALQVVVADEKEVWLEVWTVEKLGVKLFKWLSNFHILCLCSSDGIMKLLIFLFFV
ncbi:unnamed protein product [Lathyrus sativus]|nr:unnamed protein product [Lathyrus sativus]